MSSNYALEMNHIVKAFPGVLANDDVSLKVKERSIHALIGENGAGKSTLMSILSGLYQPDSGEIIIAGKTVSINSTYEAIELGIGMVHQHFMLVPGVTVLENIILGPKIKTKYGLTDYRDSRQSVMKIIEEYSFHIDLDKRVYELSVGEMQRVEIIKALYRGADILIFDEPTAVLTPQETAHLFVMMRDLVARGKTVLFISHKLKEVLEISDSVTVMRGGRVTGDIKTSEANEHILASMMVGRDVVMKVEKEKASPGDVVFSVRNLCALNDRKLPVVRDVSFDIREGEIVGIAGVDGNGQTELVEVIAGLRKKTSGTMHLNNNDITDDTCLVRRNKGMAHIPADRMVLGINKDCSVHENLILNVYNKKPYCRRKVLNNGKLINFSRDLVKRFNVAAASHDTLIGTLSGGNMQKVVVAREISSDPAFLISAQPTRGVDVGAIEFIHKELVRLRDEGKAILLVSTELDEIMSLSDRILVMYEGEIVADIVNDQVDEMEIGLYMTGAKRTSRAGIVESPVHQQEEGVKGA